MSRPGPWIAALVVVGLLASSLGLRAPSTSDGFPEIVFPGPARAAASALAVPTPSAVNGAPGTWTQIDAAVPDRGYIQMVYDSAAEMFVTHGGTTRAGYDLNETWSYDPAANLWTNRTADGSPTSRSGFGMVYDARANLIVLFGGRDTAGVFYTDTWTYNLTAHAWILLSPANAPPARANFGMAYDSAADRILVFGGYGPGLLGDTWSFDLRNDTWTDVTPANSPTPRMGPMMTYDVAAGRSVLFGGSTSVGDANDTWTFDSGTHTWTNVTQTTAPRARSEGTFSYDSHGQRDVLFGGIGRFGFVADTWTWNAATGTWLNATQAVAPPATINAGLSFSPVRDATFLFAGIPDPGGPDAFWSFDLGTRTWTNLGVPATGLVRAFQSVAFDDGAGVLVTFGGITYVPGGTAVTNQTWTLDPASGAWANRTAAVAPPARANGSMAYDPVAGRIILFGGTSFPGSILGDTWSFSLGTDTWTNVTTAGPSPRGAATMVYDASQDRMVLFGGYGPGGDLNDTWSYAVGTNTWANVTPTASPSPRISSMMAYDLAVNRTVLFGGYGSSGFLNDTWAFDLRDKTWTLQPAISPPFAMGFGRLVYDAAHDVLLLFGGFGDGGPNGNTWYYDYAHSGWNILFPAAQPPMRWSFGMAYDQADARTIVVGGFNYSAVLADAWSYRYPVPPSPPQNFTATAGTARVTLTWSAPAMSGGASLWWYSVYRGTSSGSETALQFVPSNATTYNDTGVTAGTTYYYYVTGSNIGGESARSTEAHATPTVAPDTTPPKIFIMTPVPGENLSGTQFEVAGIASDDVEVAKVELRANGGAWELANGTTSWYGTVSLRLGPNAIDARATDTSGNQNTTSVNVTVVSQVTPGPLPGWVLPLIAGAVVVAVVVVALVAYLSWKRRRPPAEPVAPTPEPPKT